MESNLDIFRRCYHNVRVVQYDDKLVYRTQFGGASAAAKYANDVIGVLKLPLEAKSNYFPFCDSFVVKEKK